MGGFSLGMMPMLPRMLFMASPSSAEAPEAANSRARAAARHKIVIPFMAPTIAFSLWLERLTAHSGEHKAALTALPGPLPVQHEGVIEQTEHPRNDGRVGHVEDVPGPCPDVELDEIEHGAIGQPVNDVAEAPPHDQPQGPGQPPPAGAADPHGQADGGQNGDHDQEPAP